MADRLSSADVSFLYLEEADTPMHVGSVAIVDGTDTPYETLLTVVRERLALVPRYRKRLRWVPGHLANPIWVDDENFDLTYHVRRSALPRPGTHERLCDLVARLMSRPLDRDKPLWEMYYVEGLEGGRVALLSKTHQAVIDGISTVDIGQVVLDPTEQSPETPQPGWQPEDEPSTLELLAGAVVDTIRRPSALLDTARSTVSDAQVTAGRLVELAGRAAGGVARTLRLAARPAPGSPLNVPIGAQRRFATVDSRLEDYRRVRAALGGSVNDVVLATVAGALRSWLFTRGVPVHSTSTVRALVPMSVLDEDPQDVDGGWSPERPRGIGGRVAEYLVDLPVGEPNPAMRLHQVSYAMQAHAETGRAVGAREIAGMTGFAPPTLHALGARVASSLTRRTFNLMITNVPGPQQPLYLAGTPMSATYPYVPLARGQALAIGLTSYHGSVCFGLNADRDAMGDLDVLTQGIPDALGELLEAADEAERALANTARQKTGQRTGQKQGTGRTAANGKRRR